MMAIVALEVLLAVLVVGLGTKLPKCVGAMALVSSLSLGYAYTLFTYSGAAIVGRGVMRAAIFAPETELGYSFEEVPVPSHTDRTLLIKVEAAGLNPSNFKLVPATIPFVRHLRKWVIGYDVAGTVVSMGSHPDCDVKVGDRVWGMAISGSIAEYTLMSCYESVGVGPIPTKMSFEEAAGLTIAGLTGLAAYERNGLQKGDDVLVIGASGGCGMFGVGIAAHVFAGNVTGLCSTKNVEFVRSLGAAQVVDYRDDAAYQRLKAGGPQFDVIYDTVTSSAPEDPNYEPDMGPLLKPKGRYVVIGPSPNPLDLLRATLDIPARLLGFGVQREGYDMFLLQANKARVRLLSSWFEQGFLPAVKIDSVFEVDSSAKMAEAMDRMKSRRTTGKIIVKVVTASP